MCKYSFLGRFVDGTIIKNASYEVGIPCHLHTTTINTSCERIYFKCVTEYKLCLLPLSHIASILLILDVKPTIVLRQFPGNFGLIHGFEIFWTTPSLTSSFSLPTRENPSTNRRFPLAPQLEKGRLRRNHEELTPNRN